MEGDVRAPALTGGGPPREGEPGSDDDGVEARLRGALDAAGLGAWSVDLVRAAVELSVGCRALFGLAADEPATLATFERHTHPDDRPALRAAMARALAADGDGALAVEHRVVHATGEVRWLRARGRTDFAETDAGRRAVGCRGIVQDVTEERRAVGDGAFILALGALLPTISDPEMILETAMWRVAEHLDVDHALVTEVDVDRARLVIHAHAPRRGGSSYVGELDLWSFTTPERLEGVARGRELVVSDAKHDPRTAGQYASSYGPLGLGAYATIPQLRAGRFVGGFTVADERPRVWTEREVELLRQTAERAWPAFESARLLRAEQEAVVERDRLLGVVRQSEAAFRAAFDHAAVGMMHLAPDGGILRANAFLARVLGYAPHELVGRNVLELSLPEERDQERLALERLARGDLSRDERERRYVRRDGSLLWGATSGTLVRDAAGAPPYILTVVNDVTARREAEAHVAATAERVERLQHVTAELSRAATVGEVCEVLVTVGREALEADAGLIVLADDAEGELRTERAFQYGGHLLEHWRTIPRSTRVPLVEAVRSRSAVWLSSRREGATRFPVLAEDPGEERHHAWAALPLVVESRAVGAVGVSFYAPREFPDEYRSFALAMAQQCAQALERARLYESERRARAEAEDARLRAEAANRTKSDFLAVMSHELRTPLNAIGGYAQLLQMGIRGPVTPEQQEDLGRIERSQRTLLGLINDVLSFAKLESGHIDYSIGRVPLGELLDGLEALVRPQLEERRLRYRYVRAHEGVSVRADHDRALQILLNLLTNAVKFTPAEGEITVWAELRESSVAMRVRDTGRGIPANKLELIFQPFVQVDTRLTRQSGGIGLGLSISRDLARAMGGDLTVESVEGEGATFTLTLPRV